MAGYRGQGCRGSRSGNDVLDLCRRDPVYDLVYFPGNEPTQTRQLSFARGIMTKEFIGQTNRAQAEG